MTKLVKHLINGELISRNQESTLDVNNPATGQSCARVCIADDKTVNQAVLAAAKAFDSWSQTSPIKRAKILFSFRELLEKHTDELIHLVTQEHGKTLGDATGSVSRAIEMLEFACNTPNLLKGSYSENVSSNMDCYTIRQPLGVCAGVSPFNFPIMVPVWMFAWATACGNTFILKPSEQNPSSTLRMAELFHEAGCPPGVLNIVNGDKDTVDSLLQHDGIATMSAVASTPVAKTIYQQAIANHKRAHTFGGAKNHCIVMPDANTEDCAKQIAGAAFGSAGERCMALSVVVTVGDKMADDLIHSLTHQIEQLTIGPGTEANIDMGPLISAPHLTKVNNAIEKGITEGATCIVDGRELDLSHLGDGYFTGATLFDNVTQDMALYQAEIFGPVLSIVRVKTFEEALVLASTHQYGNGTAIFTNQGQVAREFASKVQVGMVGINVPIPVPVAFHTFGGWKQSFNGDIGMHADQSIQFYTKQKSVTMKWPKEQNDDNHFIMPSHR